MARTSGETLATNCGRPCSLARYISPSRSSWTGRKSFSKASRLENICISPDVEDAVRLSNERLTTAPSSVTGDLIEGASSKPHSTESVRGHEDRQAEVGEVVQRLVHADQRPEPRMVVFLCHTQSRRHQPLATIDREVNDKIDHGQEPEPGRADKDKNERNGEVHAAMGEQRKKPAGSLILADRHPGRLQHEIGDDVLDGQQHHPSDQRAERY